MLASHRIPDYTVRESARARRVCLKVTHRGHVEVVVPRGFDQRRVVALVHGKQAWLEATLRRMALRHPAPHADDADSNTSSALPNTITLNAINETWQINYLAADTSRVTLTTDAAQSRLTLRGNISNASLCAMALKRWLLRTAQQHLVPWLEQLSHEKNLPFEQARVRAQKGRWGSCSRQKNININCNFYRRHWCAVCWYMNSAIPYT
jgi:predicted metal-dependent hydrolase